jgi:hypothetical protein
MLGMAPSFVGSALEMMAAPRLMPKDPPNSLKEALYYNVLIKDRSEPLYPRNPTADELVAMSFKGMEA